MKEDTMIQRIRKIFSSFRTDEEERVYSRRSVSIPSVNFESLMLTQIIPSSITSWGS